MVPSDPSALRRGMGLAPEKRCSPREEVTGPHEATIFRPPSAHQRLEIRSMTRADRMEVRHGVDVSLGPGRDIFGNRLPRLSVDLSPRAPYPAPR